MRSLHGVVESLELAARDIGRKLEKIDTLEASSKSQERAIGELKSLILEQAGDIGSLAAEMQQIKDLVLEMMPVDQRPANYVPMDRRATVKLRAVDYPPKEASPNGS